jgi:RNA polymerase sigma factor (sigma-70 family)
VTEEQAVRDPQIRRMVEYWATRYHRYPLELEDLMQEGYLGAIVAFRKWDPAGGAAYPSYAHYRIRAYIQKAYQRQFGCAATGSGGRVVTLNSLPTLTGDDYLETVPAPPSLPVADRLALREALHEAMGTLSPRQREALVQRYVLENDPEEAAEAMHTSASCVGSLALQARKRLQARLREALA